MSYDSVLKSVLVRLQYFVHRGTRRFDPPGCAFCGCGAERPAPLCAECTGLLERLAARFPKPRHETPPPNFPAHVVEADSQVADRFPVTRGRDVANLETPRQWLPYADE